MSFFIQSHELLNEITENRTGCGFRENMIQDVIVSDNMRICYNFSENISELSSIYGLEGQNAIIY